MRRIVIVSAIVLMSFSALSHAGIYRWVEADGTVMFGDNPPKGKGKAQALDLPPLTVADSYASDKASASEKPTVEPESSTYTTFKINSPASNDTLRANDGAVTVALTIEPALKKGDTVAIYLDSKQVASGDSGSFTLSEIDRGEHSIFAVLSDAKGNVIQNTEAVRFNLLRTSVLLNH